MKSMKRRDFVKTSLAATAATSTLGLGSEVLNAPSALAAEKDDNRQYYELRTYTLKAGGEPQALHEFLRAAAIPAWNRLGSTPIGVFTPQTQGEVPLLYVLIPYPSLEAFAGAAGKLAEDAEYQKAGAAYLDLPATDPAYVRFESALLRAFAGLSQLAQPPYSKEKKPRIFELRTYESHSEKAALKKIEMFNSGEIGIMQRVGLAPVFYGQMLLGNRMPNLTYMLSGENMDVHKQHWGAFGGDAEWKKISAIPDYANAKIVSKITNKFLVPTEYSQI